MTITTGAPPAAGGVTISAKLDTKTFAVPGTIDPFRLAAGAHTFTVVAKDAFGRETTTTINFTVGATIEGLICAVERAVTEGLIAAELRTSLLGAADRRQAVARPWRQDG